MQAMYTHIDASALACFHNLVLHLLLHLSNDFFDACRVDTAIGHQLMECQTADFTTDGVEGTDDDGFWRVIHHDFSTSGSLQGTDVTAFTTNYTSLHLVGLDVEHADGVFYCSL